MWGNCWDEHSILWGNCSDERSILWRNCWGKHSKLWENCWDEHPILWENCLDEQANSWDEHSILQGNCWDEHSILWEIVGTSTQYCGGIIHTTIRQKGLFAVWLLFHISLVGIIFVAFPMRYRPIFTERNAVAIILCNFIS